MKTIHVVYMSVSGHVHSFIDRLAAYADVKARQDPIYYCQISATEISNADDVHEVNSSFVMFVPTYISLSPKDHKTYYENSTLPLRELLNCGQNAYHCKGIIGNGDRFFGPTYCLTSRQYAKIYHIPLLATFESRGTKRDVEKIYGEILQQFIQTNHRLAPLKSSSLGNY